MSRPDAYRAVDYLDPADPLFEQSDKERVLGADDPATVVLPSISPGPIGQPATTTESPDSASRTRAG
jgi:hypothetical protein